MKTHNFFYGEINLHVPHLSKQQRRATEKITQSEMWQYIIFNG